MNPGYSENEAPTHVIIKIVHPDQCSRTNEGSQGFFWGGVVWGFFFCNTLTSVIHICVLYPQSHTKNTINPQQKPLSETNKNKTKQIAHFHCIIFSNSSCSSIVLLVFFNLIFTQFSSLYFLCTCFNFT